MKRRWIGLEIALLALIVAAPARAWDDVGHRQVADIAWTKLSKQAKRKIKAILLEGDPKFRPTGNDEASVREAFQKAATFPDEIKRNRTTSYESLIVPMNATFFVTAPPDPNDNENFLCKTWHYYDTPLQDAGHHAPKESNALKALTLARQELHRLELEPHPDHVRQCWWLYWIEHLVGDLHQPLHCASNFAILTDSGDAGGNLFLIVADPAQPTRTSRLHGYWDGGIGRAIATDKAQGLDPNINAVSKRWENTPSLRPTRQEAANSNIMAWIENGALLSDTVVYVGLTPNAPLPTGYADTNMGLCKKQAVLAGFRLAALLNAALKR